MNIIWLKQRYPPGTQKNYNSFFMKKYYDGKDKELEFPEGWGGCKGEPGVPPRLKSMNKLFIKRLICIL
jgi:hypothetical protein